MRRSVEVSGKTVEEILERASRYFDVPKKTFPMKCYLKAEGFSEYWYLVR